MPFTLRKRKLSALKRKLRKKKQKPKKGQLTKQQAEAVKDMVGETIAVKDVFKDNTVLTSTMSGAYPHGGNAFFSLSNTSTVVGNNAQPAERLGDSIRALNMDLRVNLTFRSKHQQTVRLLLVQFSDAASADPAQILDATAQDANQPFNVVRGFRLRTPDAKYRIIEDKIVVHNPTSSGDQAGTIIARNKYVRIYHKFKKHEKMNYVEGQGQGTGPTTNVVYLYACYASPRQADGTLFPDDVAPYISYGCRQRYMK